MIISEEADNCGIRVTRVKIRPLIIFWEMDAAAMSMQVRAESEKHTPDYLW